jgi:hypothetical protein
MADDKGLILEAIKNRLGGVPRYQLDTARIFETRPFLLGSISRVNFKRQDGSEKTIYTWVPEMDPKTGRATGTIETFNNLDELIPFVSRAPDRKNGFLSIISPVDIIAGLIAILMTITLVFIAIHNAVYDDKGEVPPILSNGIATVLGFYFGRAAAGVKHLD